MIIESREVIFDETRFSLVGRPKDQQLSTNFQDVYNDQLESQDVLANDEHVENSLKRSKRWRNAKSFGPDFEIYLVEGTRDSHCTFIPYCLNVEVNPLTYDEAMSSRDQAFREEAINDDMESIVGNKT